MLQDINISIIEQLKTVLEEMEDVVYRDALKPLHYHSIGQHVRHITEFYLCLLKGQETGIVNYDGRERNFQIENDKLFTLNILNEVINTLGINKQDFPLILQTSFGSSDVLDIPSSFFRELTYLIEHTIHHLAIIKIGLNEVYPDILIPPNFGVAHSTLKYREMVND